MRYQERLLRNLESVDYYVVESYQTGVDVCAIFKNDNGHQFLAALADYRDRSQESLDRRAQHIGAIFLAGHSSAWQGPLIILDTNDTRMLVTLTPWLERDREVLAAAQRLRSRGE